MSDEGFQVTSVEEESIVHGHLCVEQTLLGELPHHKAVLELQYVDEVRSAFKEG